MCWRNGDPNNLERVFNQAQHLLGTFDLLLTMLEYVYIYIYMEPDEDSFEFPHEECFLYLDENEEPEYPVEQQQENQGPPQLTDDEISQLDHEASLEELVRLGNMGVISEYPFPNRDAMVLDTRLVSLIADSENSSGEGEPGLWLVNFVVVTQQMNRLSHQRPVSGPSICFLCWRWYNNSVC